MSDKSEPNDPWAPPESRAPQDRVDLGKPAGGTQQPVQPSAPAQPPVHDQPTMTSMPGAGFGPAGSGEVPPPPIAPGGPARPAPGQYGYPAPAPQPTAPPSGGYGYPGYPGYPGYGAYGQSGWQQGPANGMGITAMVLGIVSVVGFCLYGLGIVLGILALVFGILGRKRVQRGEANNAGMATAGIILGSVGIVIGAAFIAFMVWAIVQDEKNNDRDSDPYSTTLVLDTRPADALTR
ncbi:DUF4190 domain-containing protein [Streptomyces sp. SP18CS02]|uniref:DUF4190 domain-containing protein n=1 Tax=Streptomyces sp. SP18CS02 TaxID=3002531 RepID=UPI002E791A1B|nr:DUF4190 domain-containing protein [Streptomyces sp. SP18CS02]MEE1756906.1 DUF4190 domain-containing protein [Streptomyces sp. SP18CS02]